MEDIDPVTIFYTNDPNNLYEIARRANEFIKKAREAGVMAKQIHISDQTCSSNDSVRAYNYTLTVTIL